MPSCSSPSTSSTAWARKPHESSTSSTPWPRSQSSMNVRNGRPARGMTGFGTVRVSGRSRVPSPPARTSACIGGSAPHALVREAGGGERLAVEVVAAVDDQRRLHGVLYIVRPVEVLELWPLGDEHRAVGALERLERRVADLHARAEHARGALPRHRVVRAHVRALALEPAGEHEAGGLTDVVGVRLERHAEERDLLAHEAVQMLLQLADGAPLLELVYFDDGGEELEVVAGVAGELFEGGDVFRKAAAPIANPRPQELRPDPLVEPHPPRHLVHVRAELLGHVRDLVDERDLGG